MIAFDIRSGDINRKENRANTARTEPGNVRMVFGSVRDVCPVDRERGRVVMCVDQDGGFPDLLDLCVQFLAFPHLRVPEGSDEESQRKGSEASDQPMVFFGGGSAKPRMWFVPPESNAPARAAEGEKQ